MWAMPNPIPNAQSITMDIYHTIFSILVTFKFLKMITPMGMPTTTPPK